jgi:hypothetical protein
VDLDLREEGDLPPPPSAVGRPPPAAAGVEGRGEGEVWWRQRGRPGVASGATRRRLGFLEAEKSLKLVALTLTYRDNSSSNRSKRL